MKILEVDGILRERKKSFWESKFKLQRTFSIKNNGEHVNNKQFRKYENAYKIDVAKFMEKNYSNLDCPYTSKVIKKLSKIIPDRNQFPESHDQSSDSSEESSEHDSKDHHDHSHTDGSSYEKARSKWTLRRDNSYYKAWQIVIMIICTYSTLMYPYYTANEFPAVYKTEPFREDKNGHSRYRFNSNFILLIGCEVIYFIDIVLHFFL